MTFKEIKEELAALALANGLADAWPYEYRRAFQATNMEELTTMVRDNFTRCCSYRVLTPDTIARWGLRQWGIVANEDVDKGLCLVTGETEVRAWGTSMVVATGKAIVHAHGVVTVVAYEDSTVHAYRSNYVVADNHSTVYVHGRGMTVVAFDSSTVYADGYTKVEVIGKDVKLYRKK